MISIIATIKRPNGNIENVDLKKKLGIGYFNKNLFAKMKAANRKAGSGEVLKVILTETATVSNLYELEKEYNDGVNEGGYGYIPDMTKDPRFKTWTEEKVEVFE